MFSGEFCEIFTNTSRRLLIYDVCSLQYSRQKKSECSWIFTVVKFPVIYFCFFISFPAVFSLRAAMATNTILFLKKENNIKKKVFKSKSVSVFLNLLDVFFSLSSFFVQSYTVRFCLKREFILLLEVWFSDDDNLNFIRQRWDEMVKKGFAFFPPKKEKRDCQG